MFNSQPSIVEYYEKLDGSQPVTEWVISLRDAQAKARVAIRIARLESGNPGDYKSVGGGVYEMRIDYGPGYRVYFASAGVQFVLLLTGGTKKTQATDIATAIEYWEDYQRRS